MPSLNPPVTSALCESRLVGTSHRSRVTAFNSFSFTLLSENASANHLESHSCKNKGLKVPCFHTLTKKGVGEGGRRARESYFRLSTVDCQLSRVSPLDSALTSKRAPKPFRSNTYEKHTHGEGGGVPNFVFRFSSFESQLSTVDCRLSTSPTIEYPNACQTHRH